MKNENYKKSKKGRRPIDIIAMLILAAIVVVMFFFTSTRHADSQEIILMEIYKSAGPNVSTASMKHYYVYSNTNSVGIRNANPDGSNNIQTKEIEQQLIDNLKQALEEYISSNPTMNSGFNINERYTFEYNGKQIIVPNPSVAGLLGYNSNEYTFYHTVEQFINTIDS